MSKKLDDLSPLVKRIMIEFLARLAEAGIPVMIIETIRTQEQHEKNLASGHSWVTHSKHLDGLAIDICPYEVYTLAPGGDKLQWNSDDPVWQKIGLIGEGLGLKWGGRWAQKDMGHLEYVSSKEV